MTRFLLSNGSISPVLGTPEHIEASRLLSFLEWFRPAPPTLVPDNSILREFVGGSILESFRMWRGGHGPA